jgi:competence protein ComEC
VKRVLTAWSDVLAKQPLALLAACALGGIMLADAWPLWTLAFGSLSVLCLAGSVWLPKRWLACVAAFAVFGCAHALRWQETFGHPLRTLPREQDGIEAEATGFFLNGPSPAGAGMSQDVMFRAHEIRLPSLQQKVNGRTDLKLTGAVFSRHFTAQGGRYHLAGALTLARQTLNPTDGDPEEYSLRNGQVAVLRVTSIIHEQPAFSLRLWLLERAEWCRAWITEQVAAGLEDDEQTTAILQTMALGTSSTDTSELERPFVESGTLHVFAVSGLHVGLIGVLGWIVLKALRVKRLPALAILIPLVIGYAYVTGWRPSAARAAYMMTLMVMAPLFLRRSRLVNALGLAALLLWMADTHEVYDVGFQLSFFVLWAIAVLVRPITRPFVKWAALDDLLPASLANWQQRWSAALRQGFLSVAGTSVAAWLGSVPLMYAVFKTLTPVGLLANLVLVPLSFIALACICLSLLAAGLGLGQTQKGFNHASWAVARAMSWSANWFASLPGAHLTFSPQVDEPDSGTRLIFPALRAAESAALLEADDARWLLDTGSRRSFTRVVEPLLQRNGVVALDGVVLSHADADHAGGAAPLLPATRVRRLIIPFHEPWPLDSRATTLWKLTRDTHAKRAELFRAYGGEVFDLAPSARLQVLYPQQEDVEDRADDRAMVALLELGTTRVLWVNDAGLPTEKKLLERLLRRDLRATVLWRSQHATDTSATPEFLMAVRPKVVITSNANEEPEEALPLNLAEYCAANSVHLLNLQESGQVTMRVLPGRLHFHLHAIDSEFSITP